MSFLTDVQGVRIAVVGCSHGELDLIYNQIVRDAHASGWDGEVDFVIMCGDFQAVRNKKDLSTMAVPPHHRKMGDFHKYYSGESVAPFQTIFIGGNHESSSYLAELPYGGWVAPNIYYMGPSSVINLGPVRVAGLSGIFKLYDYGKPRFERLPFTESDIRSVIHTREVDAKKLMLFHSPVDIGLSHDWPRGIELAGDYEGLFKARPKFEKEVRDGSLNNPAAMDVFKALRPARWFSAHHHFLYEAKANKYFLMKYEEFQKSNSTNISRFSEVLDDDDSDTAAEPSVTVKEETKPSDSIVDAPSTANIIDAPVAANIIDVPTNTNNTEPPHTATATESPVTAKDETKLVHRASPPADTPAAKRGRFEEKLIDTSSQASNENVATAHSSNKSSSGDDQPIKPEYKVKAPTGTPAKNDPKPETLVKETFMTDDNLEPAKNQKPESRIEVVAFNDSADEDIFEKLMVQEEKERAAAIKRSLAGKGEKPTKDATLRRLPTGELDLSIFDLSVWDDKPKDKTPALAPTSTAQTLVFNQDAAQRQNHLSPQQKTAALPVPNATANQIAAAGAGSSTTPAGKPEPSKATGVAPGGATASARDLLPAAFAKPAKTTARPEDLDYCKPPAGAAKATKFLALSKPGMSKQDFTRNMEIKPISGMPAQPVAAAGSAGGRGRPRFAISYDPEWLAIVRATQAMDDAASPALVKEAINKGRPHYEGLIKKERAWVEENVVAKGKLAIPHNFERTAPVFDPAEKVGSNAQPLEYSNPQTQAFCDLVGIANKFAVTPEVAVKRNAAGPVGGVAPAPGRDSGAGAGARWGGRSGGGSGGGAGFAGARGGARGGRGGFRGGGGGGGGPVRR